jgi:hypothetical protein
MYSHLDIDVTTTAMIELGSNEEVITDTTLSFGPPINPTASISGLTFSAQTVDITDTSLQYNSVVSFSIRLL